MVEIAERPVNQKRRIITLRLGALLLVPPLLIVRPYFAQEGLLVEAMELMGILLIIAAVLGRFWAILYIGYRKNDRVITDGPYSMTRNPLYFFTTLGAFGVGFLFGKVSVALVLGGAVLLVHFVTAKREEAFLRSKFGRDYADYAARVPMFLPDPRLFRTESTLVVSTDALRRNLFDAFVLLSAFPLAELAEGFYHHAGAGLLALP